KTCREAVLTRTCILRGLRGEGLAIADFVESTIPSFFSLGLKGPFMATVLQASLAEVAPSFPANEPPPQMQVRKRNGSAEPVDVNKIVRAVQRCCSGLAHVDPMRVASRTIGGLYDGATTRELDSISIQTAAALIAEEPEYSKLAARLLLSTIAKEVSGQNIYSFSQSIDLGHREGVASKAVAEFVLP